MSGFFVAVLMFQRGPERSGFLPYKKALKLKPGWEDGCWNLGSITYDKDYYAECAPAFRRLTTLKPELTAAWTMSGLCEYRLRRYDAALDSLRHAQNLGFQEAPDLSRAARLHWALLLTKTGYFENAIVVLTELTRFDRKSSEIIVAAGIAGLRQPWLPFEVPEASRNLVLKLGDAMSAVPALVGLTMIYIKREELQTALEYSERAVKAGPGDFASHES